MGFRSEQTKSTTMTPEDKIARAKKIEEDKKRKAEAKIRKAREAEQRRLSYSTIGVKDE